jgi:hypothetical protein
MIPPSLVALRETCRDDAIDLGASVIVEASCIGHNEKPSLNHADAVEPYLTVVLPVIRLIKRGDILEDVARLLEADLVVLPIGFRLRRIPVESDNYTTVSP